MYLGSGNAHEIGATYAEIFRKVLSGEPGAAQNRYDRAAQLELPGGRSIRENWVLVDLLHVWDQLGVDVFGRMRELDRPRRISQNHQVRR